MSYERPAGIGKAPHTRVPNLQAVVNTLSNNSPATVSSTVGNNFSASYASFTNLYTQKWARFFTPITSPRVIALAARLQLVAANLGPSSGLGRITALTVDWDPDTLCWNNKPAVPASDLRKNLYLNSEIATAVMIPQVFLDSQILFDLAESAFPVYGFRFEAEPAPPHGITAGVAVAGVSLTNVDIRMLITEEALIRIPVIARASSGTTRTLTTDGPHGLKVGTFFRLLNMDENYVFDEATVRRLSEASDSLGVATVPSPTTLTYSKSPSLSEATTPCEGEIQVY
jgi:hypothetical protein